MLNKRLYIYFLFAIYAIPFTQANESERTDFYRIGGAIQFNLAIEHYEFSNKAFSTYVKIHMGYSAVDAHQKEFNLSFQYCFCPEFKFYPSHHAYIVYPIGNKYYLQAEHEALCHPI